MQTPIKEKNGRDSLKWNLIRAAKQPFFKKMIIKMYSCLEDRKKTKQKTFGPGQCLDCLAYSDII